MWSMLVGLTVLLAGVTGFMVVNKHEIFPERYHPRTNFFEEQHTADSTKNEQQHSSH